VCAYLTVYISITAIIMPNVAGVLIEHRWLAVWAWVPAAPRCAA
jgi:hypothetical protein